MNLQRSNNMNYSEAIGDWVNFRQKEENESNAEYSVRKEEYNLIQKQKKENKLRALIELELQQFISLPSTSEIRSSIQLSIVATLNNLSKCGFITSYEVKSRDISESVAGPFGFPYKVIYGFSCHVTYIMFGYETEFTITG